MTVNEAIEYADEWAKLLPNDRDLVNYPLDGWRVACKLLADQVRQYRKQEEITILMLENKNINTRTPEAILRDLVYDYFQSGDFIDLQSICREAKKSLEIQAAENKHKHVCYECDGTGFRD